MRSSTPVSSVVSYKARRDSLAVSSHASCYVQVISPEPDCLAAHNRERLALATVPCLSGGTGHKFAHASP